MTEHLSPAAEFFVRLRKIDDRRLKPRDLMVLWVVARERGTMGQEVAKKLGYPARSHIQDGIRRLLDQGLMEDRRKTKDQHTPSEFYITDAGTALLADIVPHD